MIPFAIARLGPGPLDDPRSCPNPSEQAAKRCPVIGSFGLYLQQDDRTKRSRQCNFTTAINGAETGIDSCTVPPWPEPVRSGGWTSDGVIWYGIDGDGLGDQKWDLHGSPVLD